MTNLIVRRSQEVRNLYLICTVEKVYKVILKNIEQFNGLDYNTASDYYNTLERIS